MDGIVSLLDAFTGASSNLGGDLPAGGLLLLLALALFGAQLVNGLSQRPSLFHLLVSLSAMLIGALAGNALLVGWHIPLSHEVLVSTTFALIGMTVAGLMLIAAYKRVDL
jgi:hypothetical protein